MTRTITLTVAEAAAWAAVEPDGTFWLVRPGEADLLALAAPCKTCGGSRVRIDAAVAGFPGVGSCPDCPITLLGECPHPLHDTSRKDGGWAVCEPGACYDGTLTLGYAYAVGGVLPLDEMTARMLAFALDAPDWHHLVGQYALKLAVTPCSAAT